MATLTFKEFGVKLVDFSKRLADGYTVAALKAGTLQLANMRTRIFNDGLDTEDSKIGDYSTKTTLVGASSFPNDSDFDKINTPQWRTLKTGTGKNVRLVVLRGGYKSIRGIAGLRTDTVDLSFRGDLFSSLYLTQLKNGIEIRIKGEKNAIKASANEKRFNTEIFGVSKKELKQLDLLISKEVNKVIKQFFT